MSESAIREIVGQSVLDDVLVGATRPKITQRTQGSDPAHARSSTTPASSVTTVNLTDVQVPEAVIPSQRDANKALADQERFVKEAQAYANGIIPVAQGAAARMQQDARSLPRPGRRARRRPGVALLAARRGLRRGAGRHAPAPVSRYGGERAQPRAQGADRQKAGGGGNILYLPLDKLLERARRADAAPNAEADGARHATEPESVTVDGRTQGRSLMPSRAFPIVLIVGVLVVLSR